MKNVKFSSLKNGDQVSCMIEGTKIPHAIVHRDRGASHLWLCQDIMDGDRCDERHGKGYSWAVAFDEDDTDCDGASEVVLLKSKTHKTGSIDITYNCDGVEYTEGLIDGNSVIELRAKADELRKELHIIGAKLATYARCGKRGWKVVTRSKAKSK